jgi:hypothetical protein
MAFSLSHLSKRSNQTAQLRHAFYVDLNQDADKGCYLRLSEQ